MVQIQITYNGQLRCQAIHGPSRTGLITDAPTDNMGKGESFSPTDLVATALGTCILTIMGIVAQKEGFDLTGTKLVVGKEMITSPQRRIGRLAVEITVPTLLSEKQMRTLQRAAESCPVRASLHPEIQTPMTFHWTAPPVSLT